LKAVVDTNVLVSGLINLQHAPGRIVDMIRTRTLQLTVDDRILAEYQSVLLGKRLRKWVGEEDARDLLAFLFLDSEHVVADRFVAGLPDPGDAPFLEVALAGRIPLITGNRRHFPEPLCQGHCILSPSEFLQSLHGCNPPVTDP
jgi:putative PIN family toxin of toxin-antitoxin system